MERKCKTFPLNSYPNSLIKIARHSCTIFYKATIFICKSNIFNTRYCKSTINTKVVNAILLVFLSSYITFLKINRLFLLKHDVENSGGISWFHTVFLSSYITFLKINRLLLSKHDVENSGGISCFHTNINLQRVKNFYSENFTMSILQLSAK